MAISKIPVSLWHCVKTRLSLFLHAYYCVTMTLCQDASFFNILWQFQKYLCHCDTVSRCIFLYFNIWLFQKYMCHCDTVSRRIFHYFYMLIPKEPVSLWNCVKMHLSLFLHFMLFSKVPVSLWHCVKTHLSLILQPSFNSTCVTVSRRIFLYWYILFISKVPVSLWHCVKMHLYFYILCLFQKNLCHCDTVKMYIHLFSWYLLKL